MDTQRDDSHLHAMEREITDAQALLNLIIDFQSSELKYKFILRISVCVSYCEELSVEIKDYKQRRTVFIYK